ncbi:VOC family protein [Bowmanella dokdonensis]|uniref:VOC family protein n=1 Tax=Bowmanella dokdonensis TaxID=751969 RepID=A0A939DRC4_9ALTE|nr:VOC family protein [Bowmanella dokdonensis]MBN7827584.1 VOC family protein [Bowmanella dokdonensis]
MNAFATHGAFSWAELMTQDPESARGFYGELFGWQFDSMDMPDGHYHVARIGENKIAGVMAIPAQAAGTPPHWGNYVTVEDVDALPARVEMLGGTMLVQPTDIPGVGRFMLFQDPQGATLSAITYAQG